MEEFVTYVLFSQKHNKTYVGFSSDLISRIKSHNILASKGYTIKFRPWVVVYVKFFDNKAEALKHEKFLKTGKGREFMNSYRNKI